VTTAILRSPVVILLSAVTSVQASPGAEALVETRLPDGWRWTDEAVEYDRDSIYEYLDGGAMFYLSYSLESLVVRTCGGPEGVPVTVEVYAFAPGGDSHGVFLNETRGERPTGPWDDAVYGAGLLKAREGRFIVRAQSGRRGDALKEALNAVASALCVKLSSDDPPPRLLADARACVDPGEVVEDTERFFHTQDSLSSYYYLGADNVLGLSADTDCVLVHLRPGDGDARAIVLVAKYPERRLAEAAAQRLAALWGGLPTGDVAHVAQRDGGRWWGMAHGSDARLGVVLEADTRGAAERSLAILKAIAERAEGDGDDDRQ